MQRRSPVQSMHVLPDRPTSEASMTTSPSEEPAWKQRAVERSIKTAKLRAAQRVQRFLDAAQAIIIEKGSTDFTIQEVVDRSRQSLRSFYLQLGGPNPRGDRQPVGSTRSTQGRRSTALRIVASRSRSKTTTFH